jgi:glycosyltransferase involved in cell wall biosynthesis
MFLKHFCDEFEVHLVYMKDRHGDGLDQALVDRVERAHGVDYSHLGYFGFDLELYRAAREVLRDNDIDFIFADYEKSGMYAAMLSSRYSVPFVYNSHNVEFARYVNVASTNLIRLLFVPYMYAAERYACARSRFTVAISEPDAAAFRKWIPDDKLMVLPCTFEEDVFNPHYADSSSEPPVVLMVGNYRNAGNRDAAYRVYRKIVGPVVEKRPDAIFRCIGKDFPQDIRHPNIESIGFVEDLARHYREAAVVIAPISMGGGIKIKVIEALATGRYLVATPKAMEGVDPTGLVNLCVAPESEFPQRILEALARRPGRTTTNWQTIAESYGTRSLLGRMTSRLKEIATNGRAVSTATLPRRSVG